MGAIASQITSLTSAYSIVYSDADQWNQQGSASVAFVWGIHRGPVNSPHKYAENVSIWWRHHVFGIKFWLLHLMFISWIIIYNIMDKEVIHVYRIQVIDRFIHFDCKEL